MKSNKMNEEDKTFFQEFEDAWREFFKDKPEPRTDEEDRKQQEEFHYWYNNVRKHKDTGKTPVEMGKRIMNFSWDDEEEYVPIKQLLIPETEEIKDIKSITNAEEYIDILLPIESTIAEYFLDNRSITDENVKKALNNVKNNLFIEFDKTKFPLEREIQIAISLGLQNKKISLHELRLIIKFLITSIDNRNYLPDNQAYLNWICAFLGYYDENEMKRLESFYSNFCDFIGVPREMKNLMIQTIHPEKIDEKDFDNKILKIKKYQKKK